MLVLRRRLLAAGVVTWGLIRPEDLYAQTKGKVWRVGFLSAANRPASIEDDRIGGFVRGMRELGYVEGQNLTIEWRFGNGDAHRLEELAVALVQSKVEAIVTAGVPPTSAAKRATNLIPIIMGTATDPLGSGLVSNLAHPGGNITGLSNVSVDIGPKHLQLLSEIVPRLSRVGVLLDRGTSSHASIFKGIDAVAAPKGVVAIRADASNAAELSDAFLLLVRERVNAVIVPLSPLLNQQTSEIARLSLDHRLPSVSGFVEFARAGGLLSYGQNLTDHYHRAASYVDKIFKGANPGDLPIEQPTRLEMTVNRSTAQTLGLSLSPAFLLRADAVVG